MNGYTIRERTYIFATLLDVEFSFPEKIQRTAHVWNDIVSKFKNKFRNVSHTVTIKKAVETGRLRAVREGDETAPTIIRSQNHQVKDSSYFVIDGEYFMPDNDILKMLMGISPDFNIDFLSKDLGSEIIGQSIEVPMHCAVIRSIKEHLNKYLNNIKIVAHKPMVQASLF